jgi:hypothetical protein
MSSNSSYDTHNIPTESNRPSNTVGLFHIHTSPKGIWEYKRNGISPILENHTEAEMPYKISGADEGQFINKWDYRSVLVDEKFIHFYSDKNQTPKTTIKIDKSTLFKPAK